MSIAKTIGDILRADTISGSASDYVAKYPQYFSSIDDVPPHYYMSLREIVTANTSTPIIWENAIVDTYGYGRSGSRTIDIIPARILDAVDAPEGWGHSNTVGSRFAEIFILFKIGGPLKDPSDVDRVTQSELRIQRLLDYQYRTNILGHTEIPAKASNNLDPNADLKLYWQGFKNGPVDDKEIYSAYYCTYTELRLV